MRLPKFIKALTKFCDCDSNRYAIGGVRCEHSHGESSVCATDARILAAITYKDDSPVDDRHSMHDGEFATIVEAKPFAKALTATGSGKNSKHELTADLSTATIRSGGNIATASVCAGNFPRWRDVLAMKQAGKYRRVLLDPRLLKTVVELFASAVTDKSKGVTIHVGGKDMPVFLEHVTAEGEHIRVVQMPLVGEASEWVSPKVPTEQPAANVDEEETDDTPAPPPEMVDDDVLAESVAEEPASAPPAEPATVPADDDEFALPPAV